MEILDEYDDDWHMNRQEYLSPTLGPAGWDMIMARKYWQGEVYNKDENKTYFFHVEGDTKELAIDRLIEVYTRGSAHRFKASWIIKRLEKAE